jgi:hypothetical protein
MRSHSLDHQDEQPVQACLSRRFPWSGRSGLIRCSAQGGATAIMDRVGAAFVALA